MTKRNKGLRVRGIGCERRWGLLFAFAFLAAGLVLLPGNLSGQPGGTASDESTALPEGIRPTMQASRADQGRFETTPYFYERYSQINRLYKIYNPRAARTTEPFDTIGALQRERQAHLLRPGSLLFEPDAMQSETVYEVPQTPENAFRVPLSSDAE